jgi:catechol 2,3-dioxygenase-like lactoylglutathione lyase family enzyme
MGISRVRFARPTDRLDEVVAFYRDGLGLEVIGRFAGHDGYDGVMIGLPGDDVHLEFTTHVGGSPCPAPTGENLLVLYMDDVAAPVEFAERLREYGAEPVAPENPYWAKIGALTFEDPDGWRVVIAPPPPPAG